jgi:hypothetical protein
MREEYSDKGKVGHWSRSPLRPPRERFEMGDNRKPGESRQAWAVFPERYLNMKFSSFFFVIMIYKSAIM